MLAGNESTKNSATTPSGRPLPARLASSFASVLIRITPVNATKAKRKGPICAFSRYRVSTLMRFDCGPRPSTAGYYTRIRDGLLVVAERRSSHDHGTDLM